MQNLHKFILVVVILFALTGGNPSASGGGQDVTGEIPSAEPTAAPTDAPPVVVIEQPSAPDNTLATIEVIAALVTVIITVVVGFAKDRNVMAAYGNLVTGVVGSPVITGTLKTAYGNLTPEQRQYADFGLSLLDALSRATPDTADDVLTRWTADIRGTVNATVKAQNTYRQPGKSVFNQSGPLSPPQG